jgi:penicillin-binding protein 2
VFFLGTLSVYSVVLYKMQIYDPARELPADAAPPPTTTRIETIRAARGDIMDRNGETLVTSRVTYDVVLTRTAMRAAGNVNETIRELLRLKSDAGVAHTDTFPITPGAPYEYRYDMTAAQRTRLSGYLEFHDLDANISAADLIVWLKKHYDIPYTVGVAEARLIIGVRFELETRAITELRVFSQYVFAEDIPRELASRISERAFPGVSVVTGSRREFVSSSAAHLLGYTGKMDAADFEKYEELGYPMDAVIGKSGAEAAFEAYLHGTDGAKTIRTAADGTVISEEITAQPVPGANVNLTIDYKLQLAAERSLADKIQLINLEREEKERVTGGAVAVTQVKTGEVLALASYPSFDAVTRLGDEFNRATQGRYNPGSTIKMATALAGMRAGVISRYTKIEDRGIYTEHSSFQPRCWLYTQSGATHGYLDVVEALTVSCNYFFYVVGNDARPTAMAAAAHDFGLGDPTGIEIKEDAGLAATPEYVREVLNDLWYDGTTLLTAIGQGHSVYTPLQLANYAATIAGGGVLRDVTLLRSVKTYDYSGALYEHTPHTRSTVPEGDLVEILKEGMRSAVTSGTAYSAFGNYPVPVAAKTGTVQVGDAINNGVFVCYAPANDPEIAISVVVEKGSSGAEIMEIARVVLDEYFSSARGAGVVGDGELLP